MKYPYIGQGTYLLNGEIYNIDMCGLHLILSCTWPWKFYCRYENQEIALNCGMMLRECCRYEALAKIMLFSPEFYSFFDYVEVSTFDIASDAFSTFKVCV